LGSNAELRHPVGVPYDPTIYRGSVPHYVAGRPPYSPELEETLAETLGLDGRGRLLDAGCGPGMVALRLAHLFEDVVGLDPDPDMLAEAARRGDEQAIGNVSWVQALAEDLPGAAPGPYRLVTFGQSLHWTDEHHVAEVVYDLLAPGGAMALIVHTVEGRPQPANPGYPLIPHDDLKALVEQYLGSTRRSGQGYTKARGHSFQDILIQTRFGSPTVIFAPGVADLVRDTESVLSGYFSLTTSAPHLFGSRLEHFAQDARSLLQDRSPTGLFWDWPGDTEIIIARRPMAHHLQ
jgi:SAM-dependent methyltransferase